MRGPNIDSNHFLVKAVIKQKLSVIYKKKSKPALKRNKINLQNQSKLKECRSLLHTKLNLVPKQEINDEWEQIKTAIVNAARDVIQTQGMPQGMNGGMKNAKKSSKKKKKARKKWIQLKMRISWNTYIYKRNQANKICKQKKKKMAQQ